jgi:hypothetical protein
MLLYPAPAETLAWLQGSCPEGLARFDAITFAAAAERERDETPAGDDAP